jgi:hypothetical protein
VRKALWAESHGVCAAQGCGQHLVQESEAPGSGEELLTIIGQEAHIRSSRVDGPRYDPDYPAKDVDSLANLVLLCPTHHIEIDANNGKGFPVDVLVRMKRDHRKLLARSKRLDLTLTSYLSDRYSADDLAAFEQVELRPRVDAIFVDVPIGASRTAGCAEQLQMIAENAPGDVDAADLAAYVVAGAAQALLHPSWSSNALLVGGPGQGKSTLLQYLCQFHRARLLDKDEQYTGGEQGLVEVTQVVRFPVRLELRRYVAWAKETTRAPKRKKRRRKDRSAPLREELNWPPLEAYIAHEVASRTGHVFGVEDLAAVVQTQPVLLALDGLDEVAALEDRTEVSRQITRTTTVLGQYAVDLLVLAATRPGAETTATLTELPRLHLLGLTQGLRLQYLQRWARVAGLGEGDAAGLQAKFLSRQHEPHIRELAASPMQLAILLHLLYRKGLLPQQRTDLYREFISTFLDREQVQEKEPLLSEERDLIENVHQYLAWYLQSIVDEGQSAGAIQRSDLLGLLKTHLMDQPDGLKLAQQLFDSFKARVLCLVERDNGFEFDVQSLREYFAAVYIVQTTPARGGATRDDRLTHLLARPYWSNVTRFFVGQLNKGEVKGVRYNLVELSKQPLFRHHPMLRAMAALLLEDRCFQGQPELVLHEIVDFILEGPGVFFAHDGLLDPGGAELVFSERAGATQAVAHLQRRLADPEVRGPERRVAAHCLLRQHHGDTDIQTWWWDQYASTEQWLDTAAELGCLNQIPRSRSSDVEQLLTAARRDLGRVSSLLTASQGSDPAVTTLLVNDLNHGAVELVTGDAGSVLERLTQHARGQAISTTSTPGRRRDRRRAGVSIDPLPAIQEAGRLVGALRPDSTVAEVAAAARSLFRAWGEGWVVRSFVAELPHTIDLGLVADLTDAELDGLKVIVSTESRRRAAAADWQWWQECAPHQPSLEAVDWLAGALTRAHGSTLLKIQSVLEQVVAGLSVQQLRIVDRVIRRRGRQTHLQLAEELRVGTFTGSAPLLSLIRVVCSDTTRHQLDKRLAKALEATAQADLVSPVEALSVRSEVGKVSCEWFRAGRENFTTTGPAQSAGLRKISRANAKAILQAPGEWPVFLVQVAVQTLAEPIARQEPLSAVAAKDKWFEEGPESR